MHWISEQVHHWSLKCDQIYPHIMLFKMRYMLMFLQNWFLSKHQLSVDVFLKTPILRLNSSTHPVYHDQMSLPIMVAYHTNKVFCLCMLTWYLIFNRHIPDKKKRKCGQIYTYFCLFTGTKMVAIAEAICSKNFLKNSDKKEDEMWSNRYVFLFVHWNQNGSNSRSHLLKEFLKNSNKKEEEMWSNMYVFLYVYRNQSGSNSQSHML